MKTIIIGDNGEQHLAKMIRKKGCSVVSLNWRQYVDLQFLKHRVNPGDLIVIMHPFKIVLQDPFGSPEEVEIAVIQAIQEYTECCLQSLATSNPICIISTPCNLSNILPPSQTIRLKQIGNKTKIFHLWIGNGLTHIGLAKKRDPLNYADDCIPEIVADGMYKYWNEFFKVPQQQELFK